MKHYDVIWGNTVIEDASAKKVIAHPALQRIRNIWISTYGYLFNMKRNATRFDHSVGVYLLLNKYGANDTEQLAGLIHDVSHTALSHVSTYALQGKYDGPEFHEIKQQEFVEESGLGGLLEELGYASEDLLHTDKFTLLENELPDVCADRLDYALRDGLHLQTLSRQQVSQILDGLTVHDSEFMFEDEESAFLYAFNFYLLNMMFYGSPTEAHFNNDFGDLVKLAMKKGHLDEKDWFSDDLYVVDKLRSAKDKEIQDWLAKYNYDLVIYEDRDEPDIVFPKKIRVVDPKVKDGSKIRRLSEVSSVYDKIISDYKATHEKHELPVKIRYKSGSPQAQ